MQIETKNLTLIVQSPEQTRAMIDALPPSERREVSPCLAGANLLIAESLTRGCTASRFSSEGAGANVGNGAFKGPPDAHGAVEIAYGIAPETAAKVTRLKQPAL